MSNVTSWNRTRRALGVAALMSTWALCASLAYGNPPEIASTSITSEGVTLIYGSGFDGEQLEAHVQESPERDEPWGADEVRGSLERMLAGQGGEAPTPDPEDEDADWRAVEHREGNILAHNVGGRTSTTPAPVKVLHLRNEQGVSDAYVMNRPEIWGASPRQPRAGDQVTVWGVNIGRDRPAGRYFALVNEADEVVKVLPSYSPYHYHSIRPEGRFHRQVIVPEDLPPGEYQLYCWMGFGDLGWSEPHELRVRETSPRHTVVNVHDFGASGDGVTDDTDAFERAIAEAAQSQPARVRVPAGRYLISRALTLPEGVSLVGDSRESTFIKAARRFSGDLDEGMFSRPPDYDPETYEPVGWGVDWLLAGAYTDKTFMFWLQSDAGLENLTLDATEARRIASIVVIADPEAAVCRNATVRRCRLLSDRTGVVGAFDDSHTTGGVLLTASTSDMVLEHNEFRVNGVALNLLPGITRHARIRYNEFSSIAHGSFTHFMARNTQHCLIEGNVFEGGGRGKTEQGHGSIQPVRRNAYIHNTFRNLRKHDGEMLMYETGSLDWFGPIDQVSETTVSVPLTEARWEDEQYSGATALITQGRGVGQFRMVLSNTADTLVLDRPWDVEPDASSVIGVMNSGVVENLHIGNEFHDSMHYAGIYGSGVRNVWVNEVYESVSGGNVLWPISGARVMMLNLIYMNKYNERGGVMALNNRTVRPTDDAEAVKRLHKMVGNEVRGCSVEDRRYTDTSNHQPRVHHIRLMAERGASSPFEPVPGYEAGIAVWDYLGFRSHPEDERLAEHPPSSRWNLFFENQIVRCPRGILVGKAVERTILASNSFYETPQPIMDLGRETVEIDNFVHVGEERSAE